VFQELLDRFSNKTAVSEQEEKSIFLKKKKNERFLVVPQIQSSSQPLDLRYLAVSCPKSSETTYVEGV